MPTESLRQWYPRLVDALGQEQVVALVKAAGLWALMGAVLGLVLSFVAYRGFRHLRWYGGTSTAGRWAQRSVFIVVTLITMLSVGVAGLLQGVRQQSPAAITHSKLGTEILPMAADRFADGLVRIDLMMERKVSVTDAEVEARLKAFHDATWELNVPVFLQRLDSLKAVQIQPILQGFEQAMLDHAPQLKGGFVEKILHQVIQQLGTALLEKKLSAEMKRYGVDQLYQAIHERLSAEAALTGNSATIGRSDLSGFLIREALVPAISTPIHSFARHQQIICLVIAVFTCLVPPLLFRIFRKIPSLSQENSTSVAP